MFVFLAAIIISSVCMLSIDFRYKLAFFYDKKRTLVAIAIGALLFVIWDIIGISLGVFIFGNSPLTTGVMIAPHFPLEEIFFLIFLCYFSLVVFRVLEKSWRRI